MTRLVWTPQALADVEAIRGYIRRDSFRYAEITVARIILAVERLDQFPESGRVVPEVGRNNLPELILGNYRIVYRLIDGMAQVVTVHHSSRLFSAGSFDQSG